MSGRSLDRLLTGSALALMLMLAGPALGAPDENSAAIEALVPVPEPADVPPPSLVDVGGPATAAVTPKASEAAPAVAIPAAKPANDGVPLPEPANVPPPDLKDVAATPPSPDAPVADKLRELFAGKIDRIIDRKNERKPIEAVYAARQFAPLWIENGVANARAKSAIARLQQADADGLDPSDYRTPDFAAATSPETLADAELKLTMAVLTYARHAEIGRVHYSRVSADIVYNLVPPEPAEVLAKMVDAK